MSDGLVIERDGAVAADALDGEALALPAGPAASWPLPLEDGD